MHLVMYVLGDNYDRIREFFQTEAGAFIIAASLSYFGMDKVTDDPTKNCIPDELKNASVIEKREWFHSQVCSMLEIYVMDSMVTLEEQSHIWWRSSNAMILDAKESTSLRNAEFATSRNASLFADDNNTTSEKDQKTTPELEDHIFNYGCLHLSLGLLLCDAEDSVKEGDGDRLSRVWKFLTFIYRFGGGNKYALSGLWIQASLLGLLTPKDAHKFKWNRFAGLKEGPGTRIQGDLRLEQDNKVCKGQVRAMGLQNITNASVEEGTKSEGAMEKIIHNTRKDFGINKHKGHHSNKTRSATFASILEQIHHKSDTLSTLPAMNTRHSPSYVGVFFRESTRKQCISGLKNTNSSGIDKTDSCTNFLRAICVRPWVISDKIKHYPTNDKLKTLTVGSEISV